jgi:hypothetical protein
VYFDDELWLGRKQQVKSEADGSGVIHRDVSRLAY